jgi:hypothetical protein
VGATPVRTQTAFPSGVTPPGALRGPSASVADGRRQALGVLLIDGKGDLPNLLLSFPFFAPELFAPQLSRAFVTKSRSRPCHPIPHYRGEGIA